MGPRPGGRRGILAARPRRLTRRACWSRHDGVCAGVETGPACRGRGRQRGDGAGHRQRALVPGRPVAAPQRHRAARRRAGTPPARPAAGADGGARRDDAAWRIHARRRLSALAAGFAACCAAYALAMHGRRAGGAELAGTLRDTAPALLAAVALDVAAFTPGVRTRPEPRARSTSGGWSQRAGCWGTRSARGATTWRSCGTARRGSRRQEGERAARAVIDERLRIARELHDVIGHSISLIAIQSEAAARSARSNPDAVPAS